MKKLAILFIALTCIPLPARADGVIDGDTLIIGRLKYRLCGIDAPERNERGYRQATTYLRELTKGKDGEVHTGRPGHALRRPVEA